MSPPKKRTTKRKRKAARRTKKSTSSKPKGAQKKASPSNSRQLGPSLTSAQIVKAVHAIPGCAEITEAMILEDIDSGFPLNADGTVELVRWTAWLLRRHGYGEGNGHA